MKKSPRRMVIFDLDGVLTDTAKLHYIAWKHLADDLGISFSSKENDQLRGVSRRESLAILLAGRNITEKRAQQLMNQKNVYYQKLITALTSQDITAGALEILAELKKHKVYTAVASVSKNTQAVLTQLGLQNTFDVVADGYSVTKQKPAPDIFWFCAKKLNLKSEHCVVVEDAAAGVIGAHAAGMKCIGIGTTAVGSDVNLTSLSNVTRDEFIGYVDKLTV